MPPKLGIVAGGTALPGLLARSAVEGGREVFIVALQGQAEPDVVETFDHAWVRMGAAGKALEHLRREGVEEIVLAGPVTRPTLGELVPDGRALSFLATGAFSKGDDGLLSAIVRLLEKEEGFRVIGIPDILEGIVAPPGVLSDRAPDSRETADIRRGMAVLESLGQADVGQAVVVQNEVVLGIEAVEGTDALIVRARELARPGAGPVLVKFSKAGQELRVDQPVTGPGTVTSCVNAGFSGIAVETGKTLIMDLPNTIAAANRHNLFVTSLSRHDTGT